MPPSSCTWRGPNSKTNTMQSCQSLLQDSTFHALLLQIDGDLATRTRKLGCPRCGGPLHRADYPRKPRGIGANDRRRFSLCCGREGCRRRATPPSVRFLGRRVYLGVVVVLVSALRQGPSARRSRVLAETFQVDERTIRRWQHWWREVFVDTRFWMEAKARFMPPVAATELPSGFVRRFGGLGIGTSVARFLTFLAPLSAPLHLAEQFSRTVRALLGTQRLTSRLAETPQ